MDAQTVRLTHASEALVRWSSTVLILLFLTSVPAPTASALNGGHMESVENGLVEILSVAEIFSPAAVAGRPAMTLEERMIHHKVPGVSIAVVDGDGIDWAKGYGVLKADGGSPVTTESIFEAASTSKLITGVLVLHYVQQGLFDLDTDINEYLKSWKVPENEFTVDKKVTIRRLLTHRAGLPTTNFDVDDSEGNPTLIQVLNGEEPAVNAPATPDHELDSAWQYSNLGCIVLQLLLEDTLGVPFEETARQTVFGPLGMESSTFLYPLPEGLREREALPHDRDGIARPSQMHLTALGHAGLMTTPSDLARFMVELMKAYRGESDTLLSRDMAASLFHREADIDPAVLGVPLGEGLGVFLYGSDDGLVFFHPGGNTPGANCWPFASLESGKAAVIMTNGMNGQDLFMEILAAVVREYDWPVSE